uniref:Uncharacterized protein n=1 Tax=Amphimedon queenslandica TaxID=400682 RepID=A0A1X7UAC5_AMPQE
MSRVGGDLLEVVDRLEQSTSSRTPSNIGSASTRRSLLDHSSAERPMEGTVDRVGGAGAGGSGPRVECRGPSPPKIAGLGQKSCSIALNSDADELHDSQIKYFPKLQDGGGFELLQQRSNNSRQLQVIPVPQCGYDVEFLQSVVENAKIYVRPMKRELDVSYVGGSERQVACLKCKRLYPVQSLREHVMECRGETQESKSDDDDNESDLPSFREFLFDSDSSGKDVIMVDLDSPDCKDDDEEEIDLHVSASSKEIESQGNHNKPNSIKNVVDLLKVQLTPEYFTIVEGVYFKLGQLAGMSLLQVGAGFPVFSVAVFHYICGVKLEDMSPEVNQVSNAHVAQIVRECLVPCGNTSILGWAKDVVQGFCGSSGKEAELRLKRTYPGSPFTMYKEDDTTGCYKVAVFLMQCGP